MTAGRLGLLFLTAAAVFASTGCTRTLQVGTSSVERVVANSSAYILPPPGGPAVVAVTERTYTNGIQQDIALATKSTLPVQNSFRVRLYGPIKAVAEGQTAMPEQFQPLRNIDSEIRRVVPGLPLQRAPFYVQNRYGPFGYAVGRRGRETCLYGFQNIRSRQFSWNDRGSIDIRLRLCETGATEAQLLAVMYGYTANVFVDAEGWNPYGDPSKVPESLGVPGPDVYPTALGQLEPVLQQPAPPPAPAPTRRAPRRTQAAAAPVSAPPVELLQPVGPTVPPPPPSARTGPITAPQASPSASTAAPSGGATRSISTLLPPVSGSSDAAPSAPRTAVPTTTSQATSSGFGAVPAPPPDNR
nr:cellulose biosynthesis protein BcsN [Tianweitania aestuarii]